MANGSGEPPSLGVSDTEKTAGIERVDVNIPNDYFFGPNSTLEDGFDDGLDELFLSIDDHQGTQVSSGGKEHPSPSPPPAPQFKLPMQMDTRYRATNRAADKALLLTPGIGQRVMRSPLPQYGQRPPMGYPTQVTNKQARTLRTAHDFAFDWNSTSRRTRPTKRSKSLSPPTFSFFEPTPRTDDAPKKVKQRFPGPAGRLLPISKEQLRLVNQKNGTTLPMYEKVSKDAIVNSQKKSHRSAFYESDRGFLKSAPWKLLLSELGIQQKDKESIITKLNISWIRRFAKRFSTDTLIPMLVGVIHSGVNQGSKRLQRIRPETVRLYDGTGTILLALSPSFLEAYGRLLGAGTAICIKNVTAIRGKFNSVYLKANKENLLALASLVSNISPSSVVGTEEGTAEAFPQSRQSEDVYFLQAEEFNVSHKMTEFKSVLEKVKAPPKEVDPEPLKPDTAKKRSHLLWIK